jgi:large subunit ribosomal protein L6
MSRVGKQPIKVPSGVKVEIKDGQVRVEGPKGKLTHKLPKGVVVKVDAGAVQVSVAPDAVNGGALHGLNRTLLHNMVVGVSNGFSRELEIVGVGYRAQTKGNVLSMTLGFSHPVDYKLPDGIQAKVDNNTKLTLMGADKALLGLVAAKIRSFKAPEPYQGKGIKYADEVIIRKQGKAAGAK